MLKVTQHNGSRAEQELEIARISLPMLAAPSLGHCWGPGQDSLAIVGQSGGCAEPGSAAFTAI